MPPRTANLPDWAKAVGPGVIDIFADAFYPDMLAELWDDENWPEDDGSDEAKLCAGLQREEFNQYWLEVAFQCAKLDIQHAVAGTDLAPKKGGALRIIVVDGSKVDGKWAQKDKPKGRGIEQARKGKESRAHYKRIRNLL